jgi:glycosyltransferase involved in cell wall biosynthesis
MARSKNTISFILPCLNERLSLAKAIEDCHKGGALLGLPYEIIVSDNGSVDGSQEIAKQHGASVIQTSQRGYGAALINGIRHASGEYIIMGDSDATYNFQDAPLFISQLERGYDLVMGNRFAGVIQVGAMPFLHRWLGNPVLSAIGKALFGITISDFHCGLRAFKKTSILSLELSCTGMEFASEMVIKSSLADLEITEVPTSLRADHPERRPHLRTWRDGWRHLKFMLSFSPKYTFLPLSILSSIISALLIGLYLIGEVPFSGPSTLFVSFIMAIVSIAVLSDYLTTRAIFSGKYGKVKGFYHYIYTIFIGRRNSTDSLIQFAALLFATGAVLLVFIIPSATDGAPTTRGEAISLYLFGIIITMSLFIYLTAAKISTIKLLNPDNSYIDILK